MDNIKKIIKGILLYGLGISIIAIIFSQIGISNILNTFKHINIYMYIIALIMYFITIYLMSIRWRMLLNINNYKASLKNLIMLTLVGQFINNITPSMRGGSEPIRAYYLSKLENIPKSISLSTVVVERILDTIVFLTLSFLVIAYLTIDGIPYARQLFFIWIFVGIFMVFIIYIITDRYWTYKIALTIAEILSKFKLMNIPPETVEKSLDKFHKNLEYFKTNKEKMIKPLIISYVWWLIDIGRVYVLFKSIGSSVSFIGVSTTYLISLLAGMIPTLPGGLGTSDAVMMAVYSLFNVPYSVAAAGVILDRSISYVIATILGGICCYLIKKKIDKIKNEE